MIGEEVNAVIDNLCQKFGATQELLVPEMARLCIARAWVNAAFCVVLVVFSVILMIISIIKINDIELLATAIGACAIILIASLVGLWCNVSTAIQWQAAPTAKAIEYVLQMVRGR